MPGPPRMSCLPGVAGCKGPSHQENAKSAQRCCNHVARHCMTEACGNSFIQNFSQEAMSGGGAFRAICALACNGSCLSGRRQPRERMLVMDAANFRCQCGGGGDGCCRSWARPLVNRHLLGLHLLHPPPRWQQARPCCRRWQLVPPRPPRRHTSWQLQRLSCRHLPLHLLLLPRRWGQRRCASCLCLCCPCRLRHFACLRGSHRWRWWRPLRWCW